MAQDADIIDLRRSYLPINPNAMPVGLHTSQQEDQPEGRIPVIPYDGYNFMPTPQGYSSFFGINSLIDIVSVFGQEEAEAVYTPDREHVIVTYF